MAALIGLGTILTTLTLVWMISVWLRDASVADICWGLGFVLLAWLYCFLSPALTARSWLVAALITLWGARLGVHIFRRNDGKGEDPRYQAMRAAHGRAFWWRSLFTVFWLQGAILWFVALPLLVAVRATAPAALTAVDGLGVSAVRDWVRLRGRRRLSTRSASEPSPGTAARCSTADSGAIRGIRITSETPRCGGACMPWRHQRQTDGSPC